MKAFNRRSCTEVPELQLFQLIFEDRKRLLNGSQSQIIGQKEPKNKMLVLLKTDDLVLTRTLRSKRHILRIKLGCYDKAISFYW